MNLPDLIIVRLLPLRLIHNETMKVENGKKDVIGFKEYLKEFTIDAYDTAFDSKLNNAGPVSTSKDNTGQPLDNYKNDVKLQKKQIIHQYFESTGVSDDDHNGKLSGHVLYGLAAAITMKVLV